MSSGKWRPFCLGLNMLTFWFLDQNIPGKLGQSCANDLAPHIARSSAAMALIVLTF